jgi:acetylornithine deacetylase/succinyl-diaminopimelate desuccinylase-like protein/predicted glutamine amidotransferase/WD40 repeat protein
MCRLSAFFGTPICAADLVTRPSRSIITQSYDARERISGDSDSPAWLNADGFGLGWYSCDPEDTIPCVYRAARPAWNDGNLGHLAEKIVAPVLFAHVRAASPGMDVSEASCHPYVYGCYMFMHNGGVSDFNALRRALLPTLSDQIFDWAVNNGSSDSALCFAVFLNLLPDPTRTSSADAMRLYLDQAITIIRDAILSTGAPGVSLLNFVISDGNSLVASRYAVHPTDLNAAAASLYYASGNNYVADLESPADYHMVHVDRRDTLAIISSEPLTECRSDWVQVPRNSIIVVTANLHILLCEVGQSASLSSGISRALANLTGNLDVPKLSLVPELQEQRQTPQTQHQPPFTAPNGVTALYAHPRPQRPTVRVPPLTLSGLKRNSSSALGLGSHIPRAASPSPVLQRAISSQVAAASAGNGIGDGARSSGGFLRPSALHPDYAAALAPGAEQSPTVRYVIRVGRLGDEMILSTTTCGDFLCAGTQDGSIHIWYVTTRAEAVVLRGHSRAILALAADEVTGTLVSASSDSQICVWALSQPSPASLESSSGHAQFSCLRVVSCIGNGDIYSVAIVNRRVYAGFSDTMVRLVSEDIDAIAASECNMHFPASAMSCALTPSSASASCPRHHYGYVYAIVALEDEHGSAFVTGCGDGLVRVWDVASGKLLRSLEGHHGAVLSLAVAQIEGCTLLFSGSRDGTVKIWDAESGYLCKRTLRKHKSEVVTCVSSMDLVLTGSTDGQVYLWCARTLHCVAAYGSISVQAAAISVAHDLFFVAADGCKIQARDLSIQAGRRGAEEAHSRFSLSTDVGNSVSDDVGGIEDINLSGYDSVPALIPRVADDIVLATPQTTRSSVNGAIGHSHCRTGMSSSSGTDLPSAQAPEFPESDLINGDATAGIHCRSPKPPIRVEERLMQDVLARFISFPTVSGCEHHREDCWQGAKYLLSSLEGMGANAKLANLELGHNPIVLARFASTLDNAPTLVFYGHYDVMPADPAEWNSNPWTLTAVDEHYYGRGTTDNKGPILAVILAIKSLLASSKDGLGINVVLILEGEGEQSNAGFRETINAHQHWFTNTTLILTSNSYWLGEERPCITYGMRGVVDIDVTVSGGSRNLHSGVDGGAIFEPTCDLMGICSTLVDSYGHVTIPKFYDDVRPLSHDDRARLDAVQFELAEYVSRTGVKKFTSPGATELLEVRWRQPSVSVASFDTSNKSRVHSVMPNVASASLSVRFVPDQDPDVLFCRIRDHLMLEFGKRRSKNALSVTCICKGDWWLGNPSGPEFQLAERAIQSVWNMDPMFVCEGGTMPIFSFMAKTLGAPVVQVPLGQASDGAHLPNERIRAINLHKGKEVLQHMIRELSDQHKAAVSMQSRV